MTLKPLTTLAVGVSSARCSACETVPEKAWLRLLTSTRILPESRKAWDQGGLPVELCKLSLADNAVGM